MTEVAIETESFDYFFHFSFLVSLFTAHGWFCSPPTTRPHMASIIRTPPSPLPNRGWLGWSDEPLWQVSRTFLSAWGGGKNHGTTAHPCSSSVLLHLLNGDAVVTPQQGHTTDPTFQ
jgi:hypothetical protein